MVAGPRKACICLNWSVIPKKRLGTTPLNENKIEEGSRTEREQTLKMQHDRSQENVVVVAHVFFSGSTNVLPGRSHRFFNRFIDASNDLLYSFKDQA